MTSRLGTEKPLTFFYSAPSFLVSLTSVPLNPFYTLPVCYSAFCHSLSPCYSYVCHSLLVKISMTAILSVYRSLFLSLFLSVTLSLSFPLSVTLCLPTLFVSNTSLSVTHFFSYLLASACNYPVCYSPCILLSYLSLFGLSLFHASIALSSVNFPSVTVHLIITTRNNKTALVKDR